MTKASPPNANGLGALQVGYKSRDTECQNVRSKRDLQDHLKQPFPFTSLETKADRVPGRLGFKSLEAHMIWRALFKNAKQGLEQPVQMRARKLKPP